MVLCQPHSVPDELVEGAPVFVLGQNPGAEEERQGRPFVGRTGEMMMREFFPHAQLTRETVSLGNALCYRFTNAVGKRSNDLPVGKALEAALAGCRAHRRVPPSTRLVVATGAAAWRSVGQSTPVTDWRGFLAPELVHFTATDGSTIRVPVLATLHIADLFGGRNARMRWPCYRDWRKVPLFLAGRWPEAAPRITHDVMGWFAAAQAAPYIALDTEYDADNGALSLIGLGYLGSPVLQISWTAADVLERRIFVDALLAWDKPIVFQNAVADLRVLRQAGILTGDYRDILRRIKVDDTMLAHSVLWAEWPHTLEFLASVYGTHAKMKHLARTNIFLYNAGDVVDTISAWEGMREEFMRDPPSRAIYETQPVKLLPIVLRAQERGIRVNATRVLAAADEYREKMEIAAGLARAYTGRALFNVGSDDQLKEVLYAREGLPIQRHKETKRPSIDTDSIAALRGLHSPVPDYEDEEREGLSWSDIERRVAAGAHPLLEARVFYAAAQQAQSHYIAPALVALKGDGRLYPEFHVHAQANARWSTVNPPMAQLPADLRDIVMPDEGTAWIQWDWKQMEPRILDVMIGDGDALARWNEDRYERFTPVFFPGATPADPSWPDKRYFTKRRILKLHYGGSVTSVTPGAAKLGLPREQEIAASRRYLASRPALAAWWRSVRLLLAKPGIPMAVSFTGRKRRITEKGQRALRIMYDYPLQAGVSDIANLTAIRIEEELPWLDLMYQQHDGWVYQCPLDRLEKTQPLLREIVEREWLMYGRRARFPASWHIRRV